MEELPINPLPPLLPLQPTLSPPNESNLDKLPRDQLVDIASHITYQELLNYCRISTRFAVLCREPSFWLDLIRIVFPTYYFSHINKIQQPKLVYYNLISIYVISITYHSALNSYNNVYETRDYMSFLGAIAAFYDFHNIDPKMTLTVKLSGSQTFISNQIPDEDAKLRAMILPYRAASRDFDRLKNTDLVNKTITNLVYVVIGDLKHPRDYILYYINLTPEFIDFYYRASSIDRFHTKFTVITFNDITEKFETEVISHVNFT